MTIADFLQQLSASPQNIEFEHTMAVIAEHYDYQPTAFTNGDVSNAAGSNEGSCKIFAFAQLHTLDEQDTLALFGTFYRNDVLGNPEGEDHGNIRNFIQRGWSGIHFNGTALKPKS
jgi:type III HopJ-like effector protein